MTTKTLSDFGISGEAVEFEKESLPLSQFKVGTIVNVIGIEFKDLGKKPGVVFEVDTPIEDITDEPKAWTKMHTANGITVKKFKGVNLQEGDKLQVEIASGKTDKGTWYDLK